MNIKYAYEIQLEIYIDELYILITKTNCNKFDYYI